MWIDLAKAKRRLEGKKMIIPRSEQRSYPPFSPSLFSCFCLCSLFCVSPPPIGFAGLLHSVFACRVPSVYLGLCLPFLIWLDRLHPGAYVCSPDCTPCALCFACCLCLFGVVLPCVVCLVFSWVRPSLLVGLLFPFFPSNAFMAFARSFNMFYSMLQYGIN